MVSYAGIDEVRRHVFQPTADDLALLENSFLEAASRMIDAECRVKPGFFRQASTVAHDHTVIGDGTEYLRLPPHVPDSIIDVVLESDRFAPEYIELDGYLIAQGRAVWPDGEGVTVTARWRFETIPADLAQATAELAVLMLRQRDTAYSRAVSDVSGGVAGGTGQAYPERVIKFVSAWRAQRKLVIA